MWTLLVSVANVLGSVTALVAFRYGAKRGRAASSGGSQIPVPSASAVATVGMTIVLATFFVALLIFGHRK